MTLWIRIDADIGGNPNVWKFATVRELSAVQVVGHLVMLFGAVAAHAPSGDISDIPDTLLEQWAGWTGEHGVFAADFRRFFVSDGVIDGWAERQGALIERAAKDRERMARKRAANRSQTVREPSAKSSALRNGTVRNVEDPANAGTAEPPVIVKQKRPRAKQPPAPFMGRLNRTWKKHLGGDMQPGSATLLRPVVEEIGEERTDRRLDAYLEATDPQFASVRSFVAKHGAYADDQPLVDPATGVLNAAGLRVAGLAR